MSTEFMTLLRQHIIESGLQLEDIARPMKVSISAVSLWQTGKSVPRSRHIPKLAKILGLKPRALARMLYPEIEQELAVAAK